MATLQKENFSRWTINNISGSSNNCFPSICATFLELDTKEAQNDCIGYPARTGRKYGGTRIVWKNPAQQITDSFGVQATDVLDMSKNSSYNVEKHGTTSQVAKNLTEGVYVIIHRGHAYGLIVTGGKAYTVDYGKGNAARRVVWTCARLDGVNAAEMLAKFRAPKPQQMGGFMKGTFLQESDMDRMLNFRAEAILKELSQQKAKPEPKPEPKAVRVYTGDGQVHTIRTADDSRAFVRAYGMDTAVLAAQWDKIHDLQF